MNVDQCPHCSGDLSLSAARDAVRKWLSDNLREACREAGELNYDPLMTNSPVLTEANRIAASYGHKISVGDILDALAVAEVGGT